MANITRTSNITSYQFFVDGNFASAVSRATNNCQLVAVQSADALFLSSMSTRDIMQGIRHMATYGRLFLFDVKSSTAKEVLKFFSSDGVKVNCPYRSTNGSHMRILVIRVNSVLEESVVRTKRKI